MSSEVTLMVYDLHGRVVRTLVSARREGGTYAVEWDGMDDQGRLAASGIYMVWLHARAAFGNADVVDLTRSRKMILVR